MPKILKFKEFSNAKLNENRHNVNMRELVGENISIEYSEPLYESEQPPTKIEPAIIALPEDSVTIDALTETVTRFLNCQMPQSEIGFTVGNYFRGDYENKAAKCKWSEKSLCVSLTGAISDREGTVATAIEILAQHRLPIILVITETCILEITRDGNRIKPLPQTRVKRVCD